MHADAANFGARDVGDRPDRLTVDGTDGRFSRFELISWWDQRRLAAARIVVVGAGALGNEILKNLALLGIGRIFVADLDRIEHSNLARSVLFRADDRGRPKAEVAVERVRDLYPQCAVRAWVGDVVHDLGAGLFRWADVIIAGLDNREARVAVNQLAARVGRPWIDGAIERLSGVARMFDAETGPCYECTMGDADRRALAHRRSCALLTRDELETGHVPTTPTTASVVAGIQCQELVKYLHGLDTIVGQGYVFEGYAHQSYLVGYTRDPECPWHEPPPSIEMLAAGSRDVTARELLRLGRERLGSAAELELGRDLVESLECAECGETTPTFGSLTRLRETQGRCPHCAAQRSPRFYSSLRGHEAFLDRTLDELGIPPWEILVARSGDRTIGFELSGDRAAVLGELDESPMASTDTRHASSPPEPSVVEGPTP